MYCQLFRLLAYWLRYSKLLNQAEPVKTMKLNIKTGCQVKNMQMLPAREDMDLEK
jgi:hypothetical protein